jgi:hypothetical protein
MTRAVRALPRPRIETGVIRGAQPRSGLAKFGVGDAWGALPQLRIIYYLPQIKHGFAKSESRNRISAFNYQVRVCGILRLPRR